MALEDQTVAMAVAAGLGATATATGRFFLGVRKVDKVDAVQAIAVAYDKVSERTNKHVDDLSRRIDYLENEIQKRDELIFKYIIDKRVSIEPADSIQPSGTSPDSHGGDTRHTWP